MEETKTPKLAGEPYKSYFVLILIRFALLKQVRLDLVKLTDYTATHTRAVNIGQ